MTIYERRRQHLDSRLKIYLDDPKQRATQPGRVPSCRFRTNDGRSCFIGQDIPDEKYEGKMENMHIQDIITVLPESIQELGYDFLCTCQSLHDQEDYWIETGLSTYGQSHYDRLITNYCTDPC